MTTSFRERFAGPWRVEEIPAGFKVVDRDGRALAYVYAEEHGEERRPAVGEQKLSVVEALALAQAIAGLSST